jgi:alkylation response protein AidB-like acyl-CoA dehydrogenase
METEQAASMALMATLKMPDPAAVSMAKAKVGKGLTFSGQAAIQIHGGMGMTDELAVGHYFKRATMIESQFGTTDHHLARYEALSLG